MVFGLDVLTADPIAHQEWLERGLGSGRSLRDYVAAETFAGAFGHLLVIGLLLSAFIGAIGGSIGRILARPRAD